jgi:DNA-binding response OmpR family regulator
MPIKNIVLVIDDDANYALLIRIFLEQAGYGVVTAALLQDAIGLVDDGCVAVTLDLNLPDSKGRDTLIRMHAMHPHVPIIVLSGCVSEHDLAEMIALGADACLQKPPNPDMIAIAVERAIQMRNGRESIGLLQRCEERLCHAWP